MIAVFGNRHANKWLVQLFVFSLLQTGDDEHQTVKVFTQNVYGHYPNVFSLLQTGDDEHSTVKLFTQTVNGRHKKGNLVLQMGNDRLPPEESIWENKHIGQPIVGTGIF